MRMTILLAGLFIGLPAMAAPAWADCRFDRQSGNIICPKPGDGASKPRYTDRLGSKDLDSFMPGRDAPDHDQWGFDEEGNMWSYHHVSRTYYNYGTGQMCSAESSSGCF
ncbi:MAG TPA: hypothetical protein VNT30_17575 [Stellaceae bacterium]|nr:hypothetical protein [Stellaceae bacterium]